MAAEIGAVLCGIAPIDRFTDAPKGFHPSDVLPSARSVVVLAMRFPADVTSDPAAYTRERNRLGDAANELALRLATKLQEMGQSAIPINSLGPCSRGEDGRIRGRLSLKHAGMLAGLGTIGKNSLLVNDRLGNMIWLSALVTDADLAPDPLAAYEACIPECSLCIDSCPVSALDQRPMSQITCYAHAYSTDEEGEHISCYACRTICPNCLGIGSR